MHAPRPAASHAQTSTSTADNRPAQAPANQRYVWESQWGTMLIEVVGGQVLVDGQPVEPFQGA